MIAAMHEDDSPNLIEVGRILNDTLEVELFPFRFSLWPIHFSRNPYARLNYFMFFLSDPRRSSQCSEACSKGV